jgi:hypothetical protein
MVPRLHVVRVSIAAMDSREAAAELRARIDLGARVPAAVVFFCSPKYDLVALGHALAAVPCPMIGCTTSGQIGPQGFQAKGLTAAALYSDELAVTPYLIAPLHQPQACAAEVGAAARAKLGPRGKGFGLLLIDGLSIAEERVAATLSSALSGLPIIGGSAGDDLAFAETFVYFDGRFARDAATLAIFATTLPFTPIKHQDFAPTRRRLVITAADAEQRVVREINGLPAADAYANAIGATAPLERRHLSRHPLMLKVGGDYYIRSIRSVNHDKSLTMYCAIEAGIVLTLGQPLDGVVTLQRALAAAAAAVGAPQLILGCDCVLRRIQFEHDGHASEVGALLAEHRVVGFSTYGEQFNGLHVNQTFTGVALGGS